MWEKREGLFEAENKARWRETQRAKEKLLKDRNSIPLEGGLSQKIKNSLDDLFIFCSSKILFHMNVSVLKEKKVCLLYYLCLLDEKYFLFFVVLSLCVPLTRGD